MSKVNLQQIQLQYEKGVCDKLFRYELSGNHIVEIIFYREQFCHLIRKETLSDNSNQYTPVSFIVKSEKDKTKQQYTDRQEFKAILNK